jgi:hypothetical protein
MIRSRKTEFPWHRLHPTPDVAQLGADNLSRSVGNEDLRS